jgi:hypothetical protein
MGLGDLLRRFRKGEDDRAIEREVEEEEARASGHDRAVAAEDYEARKDDAYVGELLGTPTDALESDEQA